MGRLQSSAVWLSGLLAQTKKTYNRNIQSSQMTCVWADDNQARYGSVVNLRKRRKHNFTTAPHIRKVTTELSARILTRLEFALHVEPVSVRYPAASLYVAFASTKPPACMQTKTLLRLLRRHRRERTLQNINCTSTPCERHRQEKPIRFRHPL